VQSNSDLPRLTQQDEGIIAAIKLANENSEKSETRPTGGLTGSPAGQPALPAQMMVFKGETAAGLALWAH
jgi:hypothetical protein